MSIRKLAALGTAAAACALAATSAGAQESEQGAYIGADVAIVSSVLEYRIAPGGSPVQESYQTAHLRLRAGYRVTRMFAIEAHFLGAGDDTQPDPFADSFKMTTGPIAGLYGRLNIPLGEQAGLYAMAGVASVKTEYQRMSPIVGTADSEKARKFSFGAGLEVILSPQLRASADLMFYRHGDADYPTNFSGDQVDHTVTALGFGLRYLY